MPGSHAKLSPSSAERWLSCPASVRVNEALSKERGDSEGSVYAREGTLAHQLAEQVTANRYAGNRDDPAMEQRWATEHGVDNETLAEMSKHAHTYADFILETLAGVPGSSLLLEQRVDPGVPHCTGTADAVIISPELVHIVDYKYGAGIPVSAWNNPQMMLYGLGALEQYGDVLGDTETVRMTVIQPRCAGDRPSSFGMTAHELRQWKTDVAHPAAMATLDPEASFGPSQKACRFCLAAGDCRARVEAETAHDFDSPADLLDLTEIGNLLPKLDSIRDWCTALEANALDRAYSRGEEIPGHKVVMNGGRRAVEDQALAVQRLIDRGYPVEKTARLKLLPIGALEKLIGRSELPEALGDLLVKTEGKPAVVSETDRRPAIDPDGEAAKAFR